MSSQAALLFQAALDEVFVLSRAGSMPSPVSVAEMKAAEGQEVLLAAEAGAGALSSTMRQS